MIQCSYKYINNYEQMDVMSQTSVINEGSAFYNAYAQQYAQQHAPKAREEALSRSRFSLITNIEKAPKAVQLLATLFLIYPVACLAQYAKDRWVTRKIFIAQKTSDVMRQVFVDASRNLVTEKNCKSFLQRAQERLQEKLCGPSILYSQKEEIFKQLWLKAGVQKLHEKRSDNLEDWNTLKKDEEAHNKWDNKKFTQGVLKLIEAPEYLPLSLEENATLKEEDKAMRNYYLVMLEHVLKEEIIPDLYERTVAAFNGDQQKANDFFDMIHQGIFTPMIGKAFALSNKPFLGAGNSPSAIIFDLSQTQIRTSASLAEHPSQGRKQVDIHAVLNFGNRSAHTTFNFRETAAPESHNAEVEENGEIENVQPPLEATQLYAADL